MKLVLSALLAGLIIIATIDGVRDANRMICDAPYFHDHCTYKCHCPDLSPIAIDFLTTNYMTMPECTGHARYVAYPCEVVQIWLISAILSPLKVLSRFAPQISKAMPT